jgi:hypothetical protein
MKIFVRILMIVLATGFILSSCEKATVVPDQSNANQVEQVTKTLLTPEFRQALEDAMAEYQSQYSDSRSGEMIPAFIAEGVFGFFDDDMMKFAVFSTVPDEDDYLIVNPDGTVDVYMKSHDAVAEAFDYSTYESFYGEGAHMFMKYSGPAIPVFSPPGFQGLAFFVLPDSQSPASVWHGNGAVMPLLPGPERNLVAHLVASKGWKNVKRTIRIN